MHENGVLCINRPNVSHIGKGRNATWKILKGWINSSILGDLREPIFSNSGDDLSKKPGLFDLVDLGSLIAELVI